jgi:hypothetical protein
MEATLELAPATEQDRPRNGGGSGAMAPLLTAMDLFDIDGFLNVGAHGEVATLRERVFGNSSRKFF